MDWLIGISMLALAAAIFLLVLGMIRRSSDRRGDALAIGLLQNQINAGTQQVDALRQSLQDAMQALSGQVARVLADTNKTLGDRLDHTGKIIGDVRQQLGTLESSSRRMVELGADISKLQQILQPPKLRGSLGELFLADLLAQILPPTHYQLQYAFKGGETVDAVVKLRHGIVPIDAKFPLENLTRALAAETDEQRRAARKAFARDVKGHIDAIAAKYIRMDENTFDFALMYIPAENVYYETIIKEDDVTGEPPLFSYALGRRVIPVSPNSFYAYLQTIILGLKGMRVEERSREIIDNLSRLRKEFDNFSESFRLVGQHLDNSQKKFAEAQKRFGKLESKVEQVDGLARGLESADAATPEALPEEPAAGSGEGEHSGAISRPES